MTLQGGPEYGHKEATQLKQVAFRQSNSVTVDRRYQRDSSTSVTIGRHCLISALPGAIDGSPRLWVVADENVWPLVADAFNQACPDKIGGVRLLPGGEHLKSFDVLQSTLSWLANEGAGRHDLLVAVGGATVSDSAGFAASTYLRGISYINVPTTLVAQADGAVGGKTAINLPGAKNAVGAFHHPQAVVADVALLSTLPDLELRAGFAEIIKAAITQRSGSLLRYLEDNIADTQSLRTLDFIRIVSESLQIKLSHLDPDPYEHDLRRVLNFGHSIAHALEAAEDYTHVSHGFAVGIGIATACRYGVAASITTEALSTRLHALLTLMELPTCIQSGRDNVLRRLDGVRRARGGRLLYVVPRDLGDFVFLDDVDMQLLSGVLAC